MNTASRPAQDMLNPPRPYSERITQFVSNVLPFAALALVYVATQVRDAAFSFPRAAR